jgi:ribosome-associated protein
MVIICDVNQKKNKHNLKHEYFKSHGYELRSCGLPVADYVLVNDAVEDLLARKDKRGIAVKKMDFLGTYDVAVDTKQDMQEIIGNVCGKQHDRFRDELMLAKNNGIKLYVLIEDDGGYCDRRETVYNKPCTCIDDVFSWKNPRAFIFYKGKQKYPRATKGSTLAKAMITCEKKYGCEFRFCRSKDAGKVVLELLNGKCD